jgi:hypothetical protein
MYVGMYIQASLILHNFALIQLENLHPSQNYAAIFNLTGIDDLWPRLLTVGG